MSRYWMQEEQNKGTISKSDVYIGFILIREYPGCNRRVGDFEPYTSGSFLKYPEIWKPVYKKDVERDMKIEEILDSVE